MAARGKNTKSKKQRRVLICLPNTGISTRDFISGFSRFSRTHQDWHVRLSVKGIVDDSELERPGCHDGYDGIVVNEDVFLANPELTKNPGTAVVVFGTFSPVRTPAPVVFVQNDNALMGRLGARYFMQLGRFRSFGFVHTQHRCAWSDVRADAFRAELAARSRDCRVFDAPGGTAIDAWLASLPKPAAVMAACDRVAVDVAACCRSAGLAVPGQVAILGVDNDELLCEFDTPTLSSIRPRHDIAGYQAAKTLERMFRGWRPRAALRILCDEMDMVERESTAPLSPAAHLIQSALEFIRQNIRRNISSADVVRHLKVSRSLANLRFREFQGRTIGETIREERLSEACRVLSLTRLSVGRVAKLCGFPNAAHFGALFRRRFGESPGKWRRTV